MPRQMPSVGRPPCDRVAHRGAARREPLGRARERAHAGQHEHVGAAHRARRVGLDAHRRAGALERLGERVQVAGAVVEHRHARPGPATRAHGRPPARAPRAPRRARRGTAASTASRAHADAQRRAAARRQRRHLGGQPGEHAHRDAARAQARRATPGASRRRDEDEVAPPTARGSRPSARSPSRAARAGRTASRACARTHASPPSPSASAASAAPSRPGAFTLYGPRARSTSRTTSAVPDAVAHAQPGEAERLGERAQHEHAAPAGRRRGEHLGGGRPSASTYSAYASSSSTSPRAPSTTRSHRSAGSGVPVGLLGVHR